MILEAGPYFFHWFEIFRVWKYPYFVSFIEKLAFKDKKIFQKISGIGKYSLLFITG
jgi:hypothetical protein